jgi:outer membrane biosynthesis protein TonB
VLRAVSFAVLVVVTSASVSSSSAVSKPGVCMREGGRLAGVRPVSVAKLKRPPKKILGAPPTYPELLSTVRGSGPWIGEVLLDERGRVAHVWPIREPRLKPPVPAFNAAIVDAVQEWQFEPVFVNARSSPACLTVSVTIDWP